MLVYTHHSCHPHLISFILLFTFTNILFHFLIFMFMSNWYMINTGAYAGFFRGGPNFKNFWILDIHAAKRHVATSEAASLC